MHNRFGVLAMRRQCGLARRRELQSPRLNGPRLWIILCQINWRQTNNLFFFYIDKDWSTVCHVYCAFCTISRFTAPNPANTLGHHGGLSKPVRQPIIAVHFEFKVFKGIDLL